MTTHSKDGTGGMDPQDDEALWSLLGRQAPPAQASPYFARRVLREIEQPSSGHWFTRLRWLLPLTPRHAAAWSGAFAFGVLCLSAVLTNPVHPSVVTRPVVVASVAEFSAPAVEDSAPPAAPEAAPLEEVAPAQDVELIADLDNLLNREESRLWTEDDTARF